MAIESKTSLFFGWQRYRKTNDKQSFSFIGVYVDPCYTVWCTVQALYIRGLHRAPDCVAGQKWRVLLKENLSYLYLISAPLQPRKTSILHLMQDLLHWAHKLALYGLVKLGCVYNFDYMKKLLQILRENRLEKGISQEYLAGKLGISSSTISRWESKGNFPSTDKLFEYASFLSLSCYDVLALLANEQPRPVGRIEISTYNKATFNRLVDLLLKEGGNDIDFTKTHLM